MRRIGIHISSAGGVEKSAERAVALGCNTYQIFSASPRQWRAAPVKAGNAEELARLRAAHDLKPLVVHANYLINLAGAHPEFHEKSLAAFRGEVERAIALDAEYLVLHPGSSAGSTKEEAIGRLAQSIPLAAQGLEWGKLQLLIENTAGSGEQLGGSFAEVAAILAELKEVPSAACIDTCHCWVAGYDLATDAGYTATLAELEATIGLGRVPVFHLNDAKAARGSHLDRHEHIGAGQLGAVTFQRLLQDRRLAAKAFILETPVDSDEDQARDLAAIKACCASQ